MMNPRTVIASLAILSAACTAAATEQARPVRTLPEVCRAIAASGPEAIEGVWRLTSPDAEGALVAVEREATGSYIITVVESADRSLIPGTLVGRATRGSRRGEYDAWLYKSTPLAGITGGKRTGFTLTLTDEGNRLTFEPHRSRWAFNLYMSIPYLFMRPSIRNQRNRQSTSQGAERVFPTPIPPLEPIYL